MLAEVKLLGTVCTNITNTPSYRTLLTSGRCLVCLTLDALVLLITRTSEDLEQTYKDP